MRIVRVVDSHTGGQPTRVVIEGGPVLEGRTVAEKQNAFRDQYDHFRSGIVNEPRGSDVMVGALLLTPTDPANTAGVIFFNNVGVLGMCGHGTIGLIATLAYLHRIKPGTHRIETAVGIVSAELHEDGRVSVQNVASYRKERAVEVSLGDGRRISGDVAWGGNWFFLVVRHGQVLELSKVEALTEFSWQVRQAVNAQGHPEVDHVELFAASPSGHAHSRNFVLCPGKSYDRSPCGTGTSAKIACLAADGKLAEGAEWIQESIIGTRFIGSYKWDKKNPSHVLPTVTGEAFITADSNLLFEERDPFYHGII